MLKRWRGNVYSTSQRNYEAFNKTQAKSSFGCHVGRQKYALQHGGNTNHSTSLKNQSAINIYVKYVCTVAICNNHRTL